jgi:hypothetical protein
MGANMVTGDYSRGASGFWIENGKRTYPVSEVTIAGNLLEIFRTLTPANDLEFRYGTNAPTLRIEGLTVAGSETSALRAAARGRDARGRRSSPAKPRKAHSGTGPKARTNLPVSEADIAVNDLLHQQ